jgi:hypothetical protein
MEAELPSIDAAFTERTDISKGYFTSPTAIHAKPQSFFMLGYAAV